jgi:His/Glu/Gln/Arg/opine family amino acid ABC transporter permease subunit
MSFDNVINLRLLLIGSFPEGLIGGLGLNVMVAFVSFIASFLVGHLLALGRMSRITPLRWLCTAYIELVRSVPLLMVLFWFFFSIPVLLHTTPSPVWTALIALSAYASAYQAEYIRSGIQSVATGEIEAARSLGLSASAVWLRVVLPQAHRRMVPTYASYFTSMFKDSSALYLLGLVDLMQTGLILAERHPDLMLQAYLTVGSLFFIVCWAGSRLGTYLEWKLAPREPHHPTAPSMALAPLPKPRPLKEEHHAHA